MVRPPTSIKAPANQGHTGFAPKSVTSARMSEGRTTAVTHEMTRNGPSTRANMSVLCCDACEEPIAIPPFMLAAHRDGNPVFRFEMPRVPTQVVIHLPGQLNRRRRR